ncbi:MAG: osmotically inducible protein OsmC [Saprospiraceae bacterium]|nr:MAG: osmotically inducible protein OsmC [Saprospiraceae bacterium]
MKRTATAIWKGSGKEGKGTLTTQSGVFKEQPYSFRLRFENEDGKLGTNPEELIGAAHAGCYNMALAVQLSQAGYTAEELNTTATVTLENPGDGFAITTINLNLTAKVPDITESQFRELAEGAKAGCPVSKVLNADITLNINFK